MKRCGDKAIISHFFAIHTELGRGLVLRCLCKNRFGLAPLDLPHAGGHHRDTKSNEKEGKQFLEGRHMHKTKDVSLW